MNIHEECLKFISDIIRKYGNTDYSKLLYKLSFNVEYYNNGIICYLYSKEYPKVNISEKVFFKKEDEYIHADKIITSDENNNVLFVDKIYENPIIPISNLIINIADINNLAKEKNYGKDN